jgi:hypothetical protein
MVDQRHRQRREQELSERSGRRSRAEGERAPLRRHQPAERADHHGEGGAGQAETDHHAGAEMEHRRRLGIGHGRQAERIEHRARAEHRHRAEAIRHRTGHGLGGAPQQHLDRECQREQVAAPAVGARHRREEEAEPRARPEAQHRDQAAANQDDGGRAPGHRAAG